MKYKLGLVCMSEVIKKANRGLFKMCTRSGFKKLPRESALRKLSGVWLHNAYTILEILQHCASTGYISHYRVSSAIFPCVTDAELNFTYTDVPDFDLIQEAMISAGECAKANGITLSSHPDQFNVLASYTPKVVDSTIAELNHQAYILDLLGTRKSYESPMVLHLGVSPRESVETVDSYVKRFIENLYKCNDSVITRLVLENEDKGFWDCSNLLRYFGKIVPLVYDNLHAECNGGGSVSYANAFAKTWGPYTPLFHWSEGVERFNRKHADFASYVPDEVKAVPQAIWECELKSKDHAIAHIVNKLLR